jgi:hypothetical protein
VFVKIHEEWPVFGLQDDRPSDSSLACGLAWEAEVPQELRERYNAARSEWVAVQVALERTCPWRDRF